MKSTTKKSNPKNKKKAYQKFKDTDSSVKSTFFAALLFIFVIAGVGIVQQFGPSLAAELPVESLPETLTSKVMMNSGGRQPLYVDYIKGVQQFVKRFYAIDASSGGKEYDVYCLERWLSMMPDITYKKDSNPMSDVGMAYLLSQIYPNNDNFLSGKDMYVKKYISQLTIWFYQDRIAGYADDAPDDCDTSKGNINPSTCQENGQEGEAYTHYWKNSLLASEKALIKASEYWPSMEKVINEAVAAHNAGEPSYGISVNKEAIVYHLTEDNKYLESSLIEVQHQGDNFQGYKFNSESSDITFYDEAGAKIEKNTVLSADKKFKFQIPVDKIVEAGTLKVNIQFSGTFSRKLAYMYIPDSGYQKALIGVMKLEPKNTDFTLVLDVPVGGVKISKVDATTGEELEGATLVVTDKQTGKVIDQWVSTKEVHYIDPIPVGTYILTETIAPEGYEMKTTSVEFTVEKGKVTEVEMENVPDTPVPNTASFIPPYLYIIGAIVFVIGVGLILVAVKQPRHE